MCGIFLKCTPRKLVQSYVGTIVSPDCVPTSCGTLASADELTTDAMSSKLLTKVRLYRCLNNPKHQSGENFVCPTNMNDMVIDWCRPDGTLQARYCRNKQGIHYIQASQHRERGWGFTLQIIHKVLGHAEQGIRTSILYVHVHVRSDLYKECIHILLVYVNIPHKTWFLVCFFYFYCTMYMYVYITCKSVILVLS